MRIFPVQFSTNRQKTYTSFSPRFDGRGKPIDLVYIINKRKELLPQRIAEAAEKLVVESKENLPSLMELHKATYAPLLECNTMLEVHALFPEFKDVKDDVFFAKESVYKRNFESNSGGEHFGLRMLQNYWAKLMTKEEIAKDLNLKSRGSLDWSLKNIGFVGFPPNYNVLLRASDEEGNKLIAQKTTAWNALHPDLMYAKNKHAAQFCKTEEYRTAQAKRIKDYDKEHPERIEKITQNIQEAWDSCPEIKEALRIFTVNKPSYVKRVLSKACAGRKLNDTENRIRSGFYKEFWDTHPEMKEIFAEAKKKKKP